MQLRSRCAGLTHSDEGNYTCEVTNTDRSENGRDATRMLKQTFRLEAINYIDHIPRLEQSSGNVTVRMTRINIEVTLKFWLSTPMNINFQLIDV